MKHLNSLGVILTAVVLLAAPSRVAFAQTAWVMTDPVGAPVFVGPTPTLEPGKCYEVQTSTTADTVLSIRDSFLTSGTTLAGADDCATPGNGSYDLMRSCSRFCVDPSVYPSARIFWVWARSWIASEAGTGDVIIEEIASLGTSVTLGICSDTTTEVRTTCFTRFAENVSFGGVSVNQTVAGDYVQYETTERPSAGESSHVIVFAGGNNLLDQNWQIVTNGPISDPWIGSGNIDSHRTGVGGTAEYNGINPVPASWNQYTVVAGPIEAVAAGAFRVLRNDYVVEDNIWRAGTDLDNDRLGAGLEDALRTCDSAATPTYAGIACSTLPNCTTASTPSSACRQALRDSDSDGLRDDVELYGIQLYSSGGSPVSGGSLALYGANPAHYDLFLEVDYNGDTPTTTGCNEVTGSAGGLTASLDRNDAARIAHHFRNTTSTASFPNRDGMGGIAAHLDIGSRSGNPPLPEDTDGGDWGGSTCYPDNPPCTSDANCLGAGGTCCLTAGGCGGTVAQFTCISFDPRQQFMVPARRWLFRSVFKSQGAGGGQTSNCGLASYESGVSSVVHEVGHQGCLNHEGPNNTRLHALGTSSAVGNERVNYMTRMNYSYEYVGGAALGGVDAPRVSFSEGFLPDMRPLAATEACPLNPFDRYDIVDAWSSSHPGRVSFATSCPSIDLNHDGIHSTTSGVTVEARLAGGPGRTFREDIRPFQWMHESGPELVLAGSTLHRFRVGGLVSGTTVTPRLEYTSSTSYVCPENPAAGPGARFPMCTFVGSTESSFYDGGGTNRPVAVAADAITFSSAPRVVLVWRTVGGGLRTGFLAGTTQYLDALVPGVGTLPSTASGTGFPALARIGGTQTVLLTYRAQNGDLIERVGQYSGSTWVWSGATVVLSNADDSLIGSPAMTTAENSTLSLSGSGVFMVIGRRLSDGTFALEIWHRNFTGWSLRAQLPQPSLWMWGRGNISVRRYRVGGSLNHRAVVMWRAASQIPGNARTGETFVVTGPNNSFVGTWTAPEPLVNFRNGALLHAFTTEAIWDSRSTTGAQGLRGIWSEVQRCTNPCPTGTTCLTLAGGGVTSDRSACMTPDGLFQARERRAPGVDGVVPMVAEDFNEWAMMRHAYCAVLRDEGMTWAPSGYREDRASCVLAPDYGL
ncbi:MAG: hypothetical protein M3Y87_10765 [Myxococcota bacterium]|nr:hypothetical protein [Myxococcota bacterium]